MAGRLFVVSTPIGNLEDMTFRAVRILKEVDFIAAEDTRHSLKLLNHFGISKPLLSYWSQKERSASREILRRIKDGKDCALITDAGTPGISDPGYHLITEAIEQEIAVIPIPGCSALITALSVSGLAKGEFTFIGFLPTRHNERLRRLEGLSKITHTLIFYEAPHRILETLKDVLQILGDRQVAVCRELTKLHEQIIRGRLSEVIQTCESAVVAGEYVIVVEGSTEQTPDIDRAMEEVFGLLRDGLSRKEAVKAVAYRYGIKAKQLYDLSLRDNYGPDKTAL